MCIRDSDRAVKNLIRAGEDYADAAKLVRQGDEGIHLRKFGEDMEVAALQMADAKIRKDKAIATMEKIVFPKSNLSGYAHLHKIIDEMDMQAG